MSEIIQGNVAGAEIKMYLGDITSADVQAIIVPEFSSAASIDGGVGRALGFAGARSGLEAYDKIIEEEGPQAFGTAKLTKSGTSAFPYLIHVASVGSGEDKEFKTVKTCMFNALKEAEKKSLTKIASPALATGVLRDITFEQSAQAVMAGIQEYMLQGGKPLEIEFVIYTGDGNAPAIMAAYKETLKSQSYIVADENQAGTGGTDMGSWLQEQHARAAVHGVNRPKGDQEPGKTITIHIPGTKR